MDERTRALHEALRAQDADAVAQLLARGAEPGWIDARDEEGWTPIHRASRRGLTSVLAHLLRAGADVKATLSDGTDALFLAVMAGSPAALELLTRAGADIERHGGTALMRALELGDEGAFLKLLELGAKGEHTDPEMGLTLLEYAIKTGRGVLVAPLLAAGARPDGAGATRPLMAAIEKGDAQVVEALLAVGADPNVCGTYGNTPMHAAAEAGSVALAERIRAAGAALDPIEARADKTPLHWAAQNGQTAMVSWLADHGADAHRLDRDGKNARTLALAGGHDLTAGELAARGVGEQAEHADAIAEGRREVAAERERSLAAAVERTAFDGCPGLVTDGAFKGMRGRARRLDDGNVQAMLELLGAANVTVTLPLASFAFDEG